MNVIKTDQASSNQQAYWIYHNERKNHFIIVREEEMVEDNELDMLTHGYSTLTTNLFSYEEAEAYIAEYLYQKITDFRIQNGYKRLSSKRRRSYE